MSKNNKKGSAPAMKKRVDPLILGTLIFAIVVLVALVSVCVYRNSDAYVSSKSAIKVGESEVSGTEYAYYYNNTLNNFLTSNYDYLSYMGLDLNKPLSAQTCGLNQSMTWAQYFQSMVDETISQAEILYAEGQKAGFTSDKLTENVDKAIEEMKKHAQEDGGKTFEEDMKAHYGRAYTEAEIRAIIEKGEYASLYKEKVLADTEATEEQQNTYYDENKAKYWRATYRGESFAFSAEEKEGVDNKETAKKKADEMLAKITDEASFETAAKAKYTEEELKDKEENFTLKKEVACSSITEKVKTWLMDAARKPGDKTVIETSSSYDVIYFLSAGLDDYKTADVRMIYIPNEAKSDASDEDKEAEKKRIEAKVDELFNGWKGGDKTEDSFATLAKENSKDNKAETGSLYEDVNKTTFTTDLTDWIFADGRKAGDCEVIKTSTACYVLYYSAQGEEFWKENVEAAVKQNNYDSWYAEAKKTYQITKDSDIIEKVLR